MLRAKTACTFSTSDLPKLCETWCVYILTWKCAPRHNSMQFFHIRSSKSGARPSFFLTCWLQNVLRATMACNFSFLIWPGGSAPAALANLLLDPPDPQITGKTHCFTTFPTLQAPVSSFLWLFLFLSSTLLFSLTLPISAFHLSILSEVWLLNLLWINSIKGSKEDSKKASPKIILSIQSQYLWVESP